jgi:multidrug efflux pump subunit AcrB
MQWLAEVCVKRPVFATMLILSLVTVGAFSFFSLGVDLFPKIDFRRLRSRFSIRARRRRKSKRK